MHGHGLLLETHSGAANVPLSPVTPCLLSPQVSTSHSPICPPKRKSALFLSFPSQLKSSQDSSKATEDPILTMKSFSFSTTAALLAVVSLGSTFVLLTSAQSHIRCQNTIGGPCGDSSRSRDMNCCDYGYCQPWNSGYYQCLDKPALCPTQETDIDYYGNDLKTIYGILPAACCDQCSKTAGCRGYTFVNENPDGKSACYLKSALTGRAEKKGAVSGALATPPTPAPSPPPSTCQNTVGASCGNAQGTTCCPDGSFCQPWNSGYYQCIKNPQLCSTMRTDVDLPGNDLKTIYGILPSDCCDQCSKTGGCRAFTFVNENPDGKSACYLKSSGSGQQVAKKGALSAVLIYDPIPTPVTPAPTPNPTGCQTPVGAPCGNAQTGPKCCNNDGFCQPWNAGYYQCVAKPADAKCPTVVVGVDFYGMDIETKFGLLPDSCCDACYNHKDCRVFTFVNENADGKSACYLKSGLGEQRAKASAISGYKNKLANYP